MSYQILKKDACAQANSLQMWFKRPDYPGTYCLDARGGDVVADDLLIFGYGTNAMFSGHRSFPDSRLKPLLHVLLHHCERCGAGTRNGPAAVDRQDRATNICGRLGRKEQGSITDLVRLAEPL